MKIIPTVSVVLISLFLGACNQEKHQAAWWEAEKERIELTQQLELKKYRLEQILGSDFEDLQKARATSEKMVALRKSLEPQKSQVLTELQSLEQQWVGFRESMIRDQRQRAIGKSFDKLVLASGRSFEKVSVSAINDSGVTIRHSDGSARLRFDDLSAQQRWQFGLEEDLAIAAHQKESENAAEYERWVDTRLASNQAKLKEEAETARQEEIAASRTRANLLASQTVSANVSPLSRPASTVSYSSSRSYRSGPTYYNTGYSYCSPVVRRCYYPQVRSVREFMRQNTPRQTNFNNTAIP
jgi:hypothetical protein